MSFEVFVSTLMSGEEEFFYERGRGLGLAYSPYIATDAAGNLYVAECVAAESSHYRLHKITPNGNTTILAESRQGFANCEESAFSSGFAIDTAGNFYVADMHNHRIRKIRPNGEISTLAGSGKEGFADGKGNAAQFNDPYSIAIDAAGNLYTGDTGNYCIRKITPKGDVSTLAGGKEGSADGKGSAAQFARPLDIAIDAGGNLYVVDPWSNRIRKVTPEGEVNTLAGSEYGFADGQGSAAQFRNPCGITIDVAGNLYVADTNNHRIRMVTPKGEVSTLAGGDESGFADGQGSAARFCCPSDIAIDVAGNLYVVDDGNHRIRKIVICHS